MQVNNASGLKVTLALFLFKVIDKQSVANANIKLKTVENWLKNGLKTTRRNGGFFKTGGIFVANFYFNFFECIRK